MKVPIKKLEGYPFNVLPVRATKGSAAVDLRNALGDFALRPQESILVSTRLAIAVPEGYEAQVRPRSGLAAKQLVTLPNSPGTIDSDYRGELMVPLVNIGTKTQTIKMGERIAQLLISPVMTFEWSLTDDLPDTDRGEGGFGSTGSL